MRKCHLKIHCTDCDKRATCPRSVRRDKKARRPMACSASIEMTRRAADALYGRWCSSYDLGVLMFGVPVQTKSGRMSVMVRARRAINRLAKMGLVAARPGKAGVAEFTLLPEGLEVLG